MEEKKLLYRPEVARLFGVTDETISNYISYGILKAVKMSSRVYITRESVERVLTDLRSDDEIIRNIKQMRKDTAKINAEVQEEYNRARTNKSIVELLGNVTARDFLVSIVRSMGDRHITDRQAYTVCSAIEGWNMKKIGDKFGIGAPAVRIKILKVLRIFKNLPSYSSLEEKIDRLTRDNEFLLKQVSETKKSLEEAEKSLADTKIALGVRNGLKSGKQVLSDDDYELYEVLQTRLEYLDLPKRVLHILTDADVETLEDLVQYRWSDLLKFRGLGRTSLMDIKDVVESLNLDFGMDLSRFKNAYFEKTKEEYEHNK